MLTKMCSCGKIIPITEKKCSDCLDKSKKSKAEYHKRYDTTVRMNSDIYHSKQWLKVRELCKAKYNGIDIYAYYKDGIIKQGTLAHHIIEVEEDTSNRLVYNLDNLIWVSDKSHREIHARYEKDKSNTQLELMRFQKNFEEGEV